MLRFISRYASLEYNMDMKDGHFYVMNIKQYHAT